MRSDPCLCLELTEFNRNSFWILAFNNETSKFPVQSILFQYNFINGLTLAIKDIETHDDLSTWSIRTVNFEHLTHASAVKPRSMTFLPTPTIKNTRSFSSPTLLRSDHLIPGQGTLRLADPGS